MRLKVGGRLLLPSEAYREYVGAVDAAEFRKACDRGEGWFDGLCDYVFEGCAASRDLDHESQSNLVDLLREYIRVQTGR